MRQVAIAGVGYTPFTRSSGRSVLSLATEAALGAVEDAGLPVKQVDGIGSFMVLNDSVSCGALGDRKSTRLNSSHSQQSRMPSSA